MTTIRTSTSQPDLSPECIEQLRPRLLRRVAKYLSITGYRRPADAGLVLDAILGEVWLGLAELNDASGDPNQDNTWKRALRRALYREFEQGRRHRGISLDQLDNPDFILPSIDRVAENAHRLRVIEDTADTMAGAKTNPLTLTSATERLEISRRELRSECTKLWLELTHGEGPANLTRRFSRMFTLIILESDSKRSLHEARRLLRYSTMLKLPHALDSARQILTRWVARRVASHTESQESSNDSQVLPAKAE